MRAGPQESERRIALDQDALHDAALAHRIVDVDAVHGGAVVPHHEVADPPLVRVDELALGRGFGQVQQQRLGLGLGHAEDRARMRGEIDRFAPRARVHAHQPLAYRLEALARKRLGLVPPEKGQVIVLP